MHTLNQCRNWFSYLLLIALGLSAIALRFSGFGTMKKRFPLFAMFRIGDQLFVIPGLIPFLAGCWAKVSYLCWPRSPAGAPFYARSGSGAHALGRNNKQGTKETGRIIPAVATGRLSFATSIMPRQLV